MKRKTLTAAQASAAKREMDMTQEDRDRLYMKRAAQRDARKAPKSLSEFVRADKATRERIGGAVVKRAIAAQQRKSKQSTGHYGPKKN
jgi:hypothetical protein